MIKRNKNKRPDIRLADYVVVDKTKFPVRMRDVTNNLNLIVNSGDYTRCTMYDFKFNCTECASSLPGTYKNLAINICEFIDKVSKEYDKNQYTGDAYEVFRDTEMVVQLCPELPPIKDRYDSIPEYKYDNNLSWSENEYLEYEYYEKMQNIISDSTGSQYELPEYFYASPFDINKNTIDLLNEFGRYFKLDFSSISNTYESKCVLRYLKDHKMHEKN